MKILGIVGSTRKKGNTWRMVDAFLKGAKDKGMDTELIQLSGLNINPCMGCYNCSSSFRCVQSDDMEKVFQSLDSADEVIFGTPYYMMQMSGSMKILFDRLLPYFFKQSSGGKIDKKAYMAFTQQGGVNEEYNRKYLEIVKTSLDEVGLEYMDSFYSGGNAALNDVEKDSETIAKLREYYVK